MGGGGKITRETMSYKTLTKTETSAQDIKKKYKYNE